MENNEPKKSEYHEASLKIQRIANEQNKANNAQAEGILPDWFFSLNNIFKDIYSNLNETERIDGLNMIAQINQRLRASQQLEEAQQLGYRTTTFSELCPSTPKPQTQNKPIYTLLFELDCELRRLIEVYGFGSPQTKEALL